MSIVPMEKINIFSLSANKSAVLDLLQRKEIVEVREIKEKDIPQDVFSLRPEPEEFNYELELSEIEFAISFLKKASEEKPGFVDAFLPTVARADEEDLFSCFREFDYKGVVEKCKSLERQISNLRTLRAKLFTDITCLSPWKNLDIKLDEISETDKTCGLLGVVPLKIFPEFLKTLEKLSPTVYIEDVSRTKTEVNVLIVFLKEEKEAVLDFLKKSKFEEVGLEISRRTPREQISHIELLMKNTNEELEILEKESGALAKDILKLMCAHDYLLQKKAYSDTKAKLLSSDYTFMLEGWIPRKQFDALKKGLAEISSEIECVKVKPAKGEEPPVALSNKAPMRPLETIIRIYGMPRYHNIDPTPYLSAFFILFFGLCLGDAGYGISLALLSLIIMKKFSIKESTKGLLRLLMYGGLASAVVGVFTGGWFGIDLQALPPYLGWVQSLRLIDPIKDPIFMLVLALMLGVFQILFGIAIQMYINIRDGNVADAVLDDGLWIYFITSVVLYVFATAGALGAAFKSIAGYMVLAGAGILVLTQGRRQKNIFLKAATGILSLYKLVGYFSDVLSYSRLLALGLATAVIAMVVNLIGGMTAGSIPILGILLTAVIYTIGHLFNLTISSLGAFIHSGRLQFAEFFSKFVEGGGKEFRPFRKETKYVNLS